MRFIPMIALCLLLSPVPVFANESPCLEGTTSAASEKIDPELAELRYLLAAHFWFLPRYSPSPDGFYTWAIGINYAERCSMLERATFLYTKLRDQGYPVGQLDYADEFETYVSPDLKVCSCAKMFTVGAEKNVREQVEKSVLELAQSRAMGSTLTLLSVGSGQLGQEERISVQLMRAGYHVAWIFIDPVYFAYAQVGNSRPLNEGNLLAKFRRHTNNAVKNGTTCTVVGVFSSIATFAVARNLVLQEHKRSGGLTIAGFYGYPLKQEDTDKLRALYNVTKASDVFKAENQTMISETAGDLNARGIFRIMDEAQRAKASCYESYPQEGKAASQRLTASPLAVIVLDVCHHNAELVRAIKSDLLAAFWQSGDEDVTMYFANAGVDNNALQVVSQDQ